MELSELLTYKRLKYLYILIFVTIAVFLLNSFFIFFMNLRLVGYEPPIPGGPLVSQQKEKAGPPLETYDRIWQRNLFATQIEAKKGSVAKGLEIDKLALTSLNCTLIGTVIREGGASWAIILDNQSNREDKYPVGSLFNGAKVVAILRNKVVLNRDGKDELLVMGIEKIRAAKSDEQNIKAGQGEVSNFTISKDFMAQNMNNVAQIIAQVRVKPHFENSKPAGFQVNSIREGSLFKTMGFKDGDIIKGVNGQEIHSAEDIMRLYNTFKDSQLFSVHIVRDKQSKILNFKVR